ncbi:hypothetical protein CBOM_01094 [Ceraceosorus bombacis]|uniref:OTU domain-containing protein n=1 Tax=Ceraceosorus bombacis TaxID=401625 RepID=A0A0P1BBL0_9BASI|nr:hypothetical protein CBOM_01094 [Ceraceosorus bombacis]
MMGLSGVQSRGGKFSWLASMGLYQEMLALKDQAKGTGLAPQFSNLAFLNGPAHPKLHTHWPVLQDVTVRHTPTFKAFDVLAKGDFPALVFTPEEQSGGSARSISIATITLPPAVPEVLHLPVEEAHACAHMVRSLGWIAIAKHHRAFVRPKGGEWVQTSSPSTKVLLQRLGISGTLYNPFGDGHCGFRAVARAITGSEDDQQFIRNRCHQIVLEHPQVWKFICPELLEMSSIATQELLWTDKRPAEWKSGWFKRHLHAALVASAFESIVVTIGPPDPLGLPRMPEADDNFLILKVEGPQLGSSYVPLANAVITWPIVIGSAISRQIICLILQGDHFYLAEAPSDIVFSSELRNNQVLEAARMRLHELARTDQNVMRAQVAQDVFMESGNYKV